MSMREFNLTSRLPITQVIVTRREIRTSIESVLYR